VCEAEQASTAFFLALNTAGGYHNEAVRTSVRASVHLRAYVGSYVCDASLHLLMGFGSLLVWRWLARGGGWRVVCAPRWAVAAMLV
jgi:hypothetical protein